MSTHLRFDLPYSTNPDLDFLLSEVAESIQLTETQYDLAETRYHSVGEWLSAPDSPLATSTPRVYAQGSMALETTVKPIGEVEHDLDLVCEIKPGVWDAMTLYQIVHDRLAAHGTYAGMLTKKKRCVCLEYAGDFHLDIIPAVSAPHLGGSSILVPDRKLQAWTPSNPKGYVAWFQSRSQTLLTEKLAKAEPLPAQRAAKQKAPLAVAVQLVKRARDVLFDGSDDAPRSIVLTTLAGLHYTGDTSVSSTLVSLLASMHDQLRTAPPEGFELSNPSNPSEKFSDGFTPERVEALRGFLAKLGSRMQRLLGTRGIPELKTGLEEVFGVAPVAPALKKFAELLKTRRTDSSLTYASSGLGIVAPVTGGTVRGHTYFGD